MQTLVDRIILAMLSLASIGILGVSLLIIVGCIANIISGNETPFMVRVLGH